MKRFFCASVPHAIIVGPISPRPRELAIGGTSTRAISSQKSDCCIKVALRPPYSLGQETAAQRPSWSLRCQARRYGKDSSSGFSRHSAQSLGALLANQARSSSRKLDSSGVNFKSTKYAPSFSRDTSARSRANAQSAEWPVKNSFSSPPTLGAVCPVRANIFSEYLF